MKSSKTLGPRITLAGAIGVALAFIVATANGHSPQPAAAQTAPVPVDVRVVNTPVVKSQENGARQPVALSSGTVNFITGSNKAVGSPLRVFTVPAGKRLVLEFWSAEIHVPIGQRSRVKVEGCAANSIYLPLGPPTNFGSAAVDSQINSGSLTAYCNAGDSISATFQKNLSVGAADAGELTFFGHLVNVP